MDNKDKWLKEAANAFSSLFLSENLTELDSAIFGSEFGNVRSGQSVALLDCDDINFKRIRSNRLKLLGYKWQAESKTWIKNYPEVIGT